MLKVAAIFATIFLAGCVAPQPTATQLSQSAAAPIATAADIAGTYDDYAKDQPGKSLWRSLTGIDDFEAATRPADCASVRLLPSDKGLLIELLRGGVVIDRRTLPFKFADGYYHGTQQINRPQTSDVPATHVAESLTLGQHSDGAMVVVSFSKVWPSSPVFWFIMIFDRPDDQLRTNTFARNTEPPSTAK